MTKERIAEIRRDIDECTLGVSFLKADLRECLDEIERLQKQIENMKQEELHKGIERDLNT